MFKLFRIFYILHQKTMETKQTGYRSKKHQQLTKRYCQTIELKDHPELIATYVKKHSQTEAWPEILCGIREVGILEMELYNLGNRVFMIVETPLDFDWDTAMKTLSGLHRQSEWEATMSIFQKAEAGASSAEKWTLMDRIFHLYE